MTRMKKKKFTKKESMLEDLEKRRSHMNKIKSTGEMKDPGGTPALIECGSEVKPLTFMAIYLSTREENLQSTS